ncbi:carboxypeptidase-like regulatory domain-containing protein [Alistipes sp.]|uniref:carboxypeptidase-like regulatory domain-containing protein n=1 Tax=Alistipes sp. TaxID=1872444 RepID=UPI003AEF4463
MKKPSKFQFGILSFIFFLSGLFIYSCSKVEPQQRVPENNPFEQIGKLHNEGVECVYKELEKGSETRTVNAEDLDQQIGAAIREFLKSKDLDGDHLFSTRADQDEKSPQVEWSEGVKSYFEELRRIFQNSSVDVIFDRIGRLNDRIEADRQLSRSEKDALFCCTATAASSLEYWLSNYARWKRLVAQYVADPVTRSGGRKVKGRVEDTSGWAVIGASVVQRGTTNGTITDMDGHFEIEVTSSDSELMISYIGYRTELIKVGRNENVKVVLKEDAESLDEVKDVALKDAAGALGGAVSGAITGSTAGGLGAVPGAGVGALAGGIAASVEALF